jgi:RimJ/RimL family protein N-acetyltransferase
MIAESQDDEHLRRGRAHCPVLATGRLTLRAPDMRDAGEIARLANNVKVASMMTAMPHPYTQDDAHQFIRRAAEPDRPGCIYALAERTTAAFLGCAGLSVDGEGRIQLGFWLGEPHWGKGYATEAAHALTDFAFESLKVDRLFTRCRISNTASRRVIEKCGFQFTGIGLLNSLAAGQFSAEHFTLEKRVWASLKSWG